MKFLTTDQAIEWLRDGQNLELYEVLDREYDPDGNLGLILGPAFSTNLRDIRDDLNRTEPTDHDLRDYLRPYAVYRS